MKAVRPAAMALAGLVVFGGASGAEATIINISARGYTDITLDPGDYLVTVIGTAEGGAYNGWNDSCPTGACDSGWSEAFIAESSPPSIGDQIDVFGLGTTYASALDALGAIQLASSITHGSLEFGVPGSLSLLAAVQYPLLVHDAGMPTRLTVATMDGDLENNFGGVSLSVTPVPEPMCWILMIGGFALAGSVLRRRRRVVAQATSTDLVTPQVS